MLILADKPFQDHQRCNYRNRLALCQSLQQLDRFKVKLFLCELILYEHCYRRNCCTDIWKFYRKDTLRATNSLYIIHNKQNLSTMPNDVIQELSNSPTIFKSLRSNKITIQIVPNPINLPQRNPMPTFP